MSPNDESLFNFAEPTTPVIASTALLNPTDVRQNAIVRSGQAFSVATAGGQIIGRPAWTPTVVYMAQLRMESHRTVRPNYGTNKDHEHDQEFLKLRESIAQMGINLEPLLCETTGETAIIDGQEYPVLRVRAGGRRYWALYDLGCSEALVRVLPEEVEEQDRLMLGLLQNQLHEPLAILDRCDVIHTLHKVHGVKQHIIAKKTGYDQSYVSRLSKAAEQPARIRTYLSNESLTIEQVALLAERVPNEDQRVLIAHFCVQEALTATQTKDLLTDVLPPPGIDPSKLLLPPDYPGGKVQCQALNGNIGTNSNRSSSKIVHYWGRNAPLVASKKRILDHPHSVVLSGTKDHPMVSIHSLESRTFFRDLEKQKVTAVELERMEEAMLSDLEAIRVAMERLPDYESDADE